MQKPKVPLCVDCLLLMILSGLLMNFVLHVENVGFVQEHSQELVFLYFQSYTRKFLRSESRKPHFCIYFLTSPHSCSTTEV